MAPVAAVGDVGDGARVGAAVGTGVGVDEVPVVELLPQATSNSINTRLLNASTVPLET